MKRTFPVFALFLLASFQASDAEPEAKPLNVVFIIADQWRAQAFGFAGDPNAKTPNFDRFERECVNFTQAVSGLPVCSPTRATLLTGQRPQTHGVFLNDVPLNPEADTIAKEFKTAGYDTGCIGKWHVDGHGRTSFIPPERRQGFDYWKVLECTHTYNRSLYYGDGPEKQMWDGYDAAAQTRDAQAYLQQHANSAKPFLLWLAWGPPHNPYDTAPEKYRAMYDPEKIELRGNVPADLAATARKELAGYYAHCTALDDCMGDLLRTLQETHLAERTIVVVTADHGDMIESQAQQRKQRPWEESVRVPMLFRLPASLSATPRRVEGTINTEDVTTTILGLCGRPIPKGMEGLDFTAYIRDKGPDPSGGATVIRCVSPFGEYTRLKGGKEYREIRTARYSYARDLQGPWLLYDNQKDPWQRENLIGKPEYAAKQAELEALLKRKLAEQHDEFRPGAEYIAKWGYKVDGTGTAPY